MMECYSAMKRNELLIHTNTIDTHKTIMWKGIKQKNTYCIIPLKHNSRKCKLIYNDRKICGYLQMGGEGAIGTDTKGHRKFSGVMAIFIIFI